MKSRAAVINQAALIVMLSATAGCNDFLRVNNPNVVDAGQIDPVALAPSLALSAQQDLAYAYGRFAVWGGLFVGELESADINYPANTFAYRSVDPSMTYVDYPHQTGQAAGSSYYEQPVRARAAAAKLLTALKGTAGEDTSTSVSRAAMVAGFAFLMVAEHMCIGTVDGGPAIATAALLDSSVAYFTTAITVATANTSATSRELLNIARVGRARTHLQAGDNAKALADAQAVDAGFTYSFPYSADPANLNRLGNFLWHHTLIGTISVPPAFRGLNDPRVVVTPPGQHSISSNDGVTVMWVQGKFAAYGSAMRLASRLEADYIAAEATGTSSMLVLIGQRRAASGQPAYSGATDDASVMQELMNQRGRDFWLEARRIGDFRRRPAAVAGVPVTGTPYRKPAYGNIGNQTCWPLPDKEVFNNPNLRP